jgi:hypothetical protein
MGGTAQHDGRLTREAVDGARFDELVRLLGAAAGEQGALASARDRVEEHRRATPRPAVATGSAGRETVAAGPVPRQLPADTVAFTGRSPELAALDALLERAKAHQRSWGRDEPTRAAGDLSELRSRGRLIARPAASS